MFNINVIADEIINLANDNGLYINRLTLQNFLYILKKECAIRYGYSIFSENITIERFGAYIPCIDTKYAAYGKLDINNSAEKRTNTDLPNTIRNNIRTILEPYINAQKNNNQFMNSVVKEMNEENPNTSSIVRVYAEMESNDPLKLQAILSHHADYIIDFENNNDIVTSISNVMTYTENTGNEQKIKMLATIMRDIVACKIVLNEGLSPDKKEIYDDIEKMLNKLTKLGY